VLRSQLLDDHQDSISPSTGALQPSRLSGGLNRDNHHRVNFCNEALPEAVASSHRFYSEFLAEAALLHRTCSYGERPIQNAALRVNSRARDKVRAKVQEQIDKAVDKVVLQSTVAADAGRPSLMIQGLKT
jgi:hypothetical protein